MQVDNDAEGARTMRTMRRCDTQCILTTARSPLNYVSLVLTSSIYDQLDIFGPD
jgi:hypothetical protein